MNQDAAERHAQWSARHESVALNEAAAALDRGRALCGLSMVDGERAIATVKTIGAQKGRGWEDALMWAFDHALKGNPHQYGTPQDPYGFATAVCSRVRPSVLIQCVVSDLEFRKPAPHAPMFLLAGGARVAFQFTITNDRDYLPAFIDSLRVRKDAIPMLERAIEFGLPIHAAARSIVSFALLRGVPEQKPFVQQCAGIKSQEFRSEMADLIDERFARVKIDINSPQDQHHTWLWDLRGQLRSQLKLVAMQPMMSMSAP